MQQLSVQNKFVSMVEMCLSSGGFSYVDEGVLLHFRDGEIEVGRGIC